jgi:deoxycytidylate deaminase
MGAIIVRGGAVLSQAHNLGRKTGTGIPNRGRHAEERALSPHRDFTGATICVARLDSKISKPCENCWRKIKKAGIRKIIYVDANDNVIIENVAREET